MNVPFLQVNAQNHMLRYPIYNNYALYKGTSGQVKATVISAVDPVPTLMPLFLSRAQGQLVLHVPLVLFNDKKEVHTVDIYQRAHVIPSFEFK